MTVTEGSLLVIAACNVVAIGGAVFAVTQVRAMAKKLEEKTEPVIEKIHRLSAHVEKIYGNIEEISDSAKDLQRRVMGTASRVINEIEPPIRTLTAVVAGVRAGLGRLFDTGAAHNHNHNRRSDDPVMTGGTKNG